MLTEIEKSWCYPELDLKKDGTVLFVTSGGRVLIVKEKTDKVSTGKYQGQIGVVCETRDSSFESDEETLLRGIEQELGVKKQEISQYFQKNSQSYRGSCIFIPGVIAHVYSLECKDPDGLVEKMKKSGDGEVEFFGWLALSELNNLQNKNKLRPGVENVLKSIPNLANI